MDEAVQVMDGNVMSNIVVAEIEQQVATARKYPRSVSRFLKEAETMATITQQVADDCTYVLPRKDKGGQTRNIEGPSARFAEIVASAWGNCRAGARVVSEDKEFVVAQGAFHDLERNVAITFEVRRRITDRNGRKFSPDMIAVTGNAAASIALRNAVFKGVPKAYWQPAWEAARKASLGDSKTLATRRLDALAYLQKFGASEAQILASLGVRGVEDINVEHLGVLKGLATALRDGDTTLEQAFPQEAVVVPAVSIAVAQPQPAAPTAPTPALPAAPASGSQPPIILPWQFRELPDAPMLPLGTLGLRDALGTVQRWDGQAWQDAPESAAEEVVLSCRKALMAFFKTKRLERAKAMTWIKETAALPSVPTTMGDVALSSLLRCVQAVELDGMSEA
jgi:hypothetical protein